MYPKYLDFLYKPAEQEFFAKFEGIYGRDDNGNAVAIRLHSNDKKSAQKDEMIFYCDKILIGETLESAIKRALLDDFGLKLIDFDLLVFMIDTAKNKFGKPITRFTINAYVEYGNLKSNKVVGYNVAWVDRNKYLYDKNEPEALGWLKQHTTSTLLGKDKHVKREYVLSFVKNLYTAGAIDITLGELAREQDQIESEERLNPDLLRIRLPKDMKLRNAALNIFDKGFNDIIPQRDKANDADRITFYWN